MSFDDYSAIAPECKRPAARVCAAIIAVAALCGLGFFGEASAQQRDGQDSEPIFGAADGPFSAEVYTGGNRRASSLAEGCLGYVSLAPTYIFNHVPSDPSAALRFSVDAPNDTTLLVQLPNGEFRCDDDSGDHLNPELIIANPEFGPYRIWVGAYPGASLTQAVLSVGAAVSAAPAPPPRGERTELPNFPWPPPQPSDRVALSPSRFADDTTFGAIDDRISAALSAARYSESSYYRVPGGFAVVARLERIRDDARPAPPDSRFLPPSENEAENPLAFIHNLFFAPAGYYRQVVFIVTDKSFSADAPPPSAEEALELLENGAARLPSSVRSMRMTPDHRVHALIYEFEKRGAEAAAVRRPGGWEAEVHLRRAGLLEALPRRR